MSTPAVFLDKDGTLIEDVPYNVDPTLIRLNAGVPVGLQALHNGGYLLVVVSNQSGLARGLFAESALNDVSQRIAQLLSPVPLAGWYCCPHGPTDGCDCRKPSPGLLWRAARELGIDLKRSWMIGDILDDVEAGRRAGCRTILIENGNETEWKLSAEREPDFRADNLAIAARHILHAPMSMSLAGRRHSLAH